jgi:uridine kinase
MVCAGSEARAATQDLGEAMVVESSGSGMLERIRRIPRQWRRTTIVAIDGCGGSGKSTLANAIASRMANTRIVRTDDFSRPDALGWEWQRLQDQVLSPINGNRAGRYQRYDWATGRLAEWYDVRVGGTLIVEGVSSMRRELGRYWDLAIWISCSYETRLKRGIARDGEARRRQWVEVWIPEEARYFQEQRPDLRADIVINGEAPLEL